jgi:DNA-binding NarL/FixJ family response regulator
MLGHHVMARITDGSLTALCVAPIRRRSKDMAKSPNDGPWRGKVKPTGGRSLAEQKSASLRILQSENRRLRDLVISLCAALIENLTHDIGSELRTINRDNTKPSAPVAEGLPSSFPGHELLTSRERVVLAQILKGASSKEIARTLAISARTVESHRANILLKLGAKNTAELVRIVLGE